MKYDCLIIDDEKLLADSTAEYFNLFGVKTAVVYSACECRNFFIEHTAQLLLLDINLRDGSGFELCKELRGKTEIPILFISARTSDDDKIAALNIGGDDYIQKPYSLGVLLAKVKVVLKRYGQSTDTGYSDGYLTIDHKQELFEEVWQDKFTGDGTLNVHIRKIREAIERKPGRPEYIITVWGDGYKFIGGIQ